MRKWGGSNPNRNPATMAKMSDAAER